MMESCTATNFVICRPTHPQISSGRSSQGEWGELCRWHAWERREKCIWFWWENQKERDHSEDRGVDGRMGSEMDVRVISWGVQWIQLAKDRTGGGLLWTRWWTFGFWNHRASLSWYFILCSFRRIESVTAEIILIITVFLCQCLYFFRIRSPRALYLQTAYVLSVESGFASWLDPG
jgi:hypothetical protein